MDKMTHLYSRYLSEICHCYADENGNHPCDQQEISFDDWRSEQMFGTKKS